MRNVKKLYDYDREILEDKHGKQAYACAAYALGVAIGFSILVLLLPDPEGSKKAENMIVVFHTFSFSLVCYAAFMWFCARLFRSFLKGILFLMNWFVFPAIMFGFANSVYGILTT